MAKQISLDEAAALVKDGMTIMVGGFMGNGSPHKLIDKLVEKGVKDLTLICNDTGFGGGVAPEDYGTGKMVAKHQFKKIIASHVGLNKETGRQREAGETEVILQPQGTLAEQIRCQGAGIAGFLTPTGVGTPVEEGKQKITLNGKEYLLELPLRADIALVGAKRCDKSGNVQFHGSTRNFGEIMLTAADVTVVEVEEVVEVGKVDPDFVHVPGIFVDYIVEGK